MSHKILVSANFSTDWISNGSKAKGINIAHKKGIQSCLNFHFDFMYNQIPNQG